MTEHEAAAEELWNLFETAIDTQPSIDKKPVTAEIVRLITAGNKPAELMSAVESYGERSRTQKVKMMASSFFSSGKWRHHLTRKKPDNNFTPSPTESKPLTNDGISRVECQPVCRCGRQMQMAWNPYEAEWRNLGCNKCRAKYRPIINKILKELDGKRDVLIRRLRNEEVKPEPDPCGRCGELTHWVWKSKIRMWQKLICDCYIRAMHGMGA